MAGARESSGAAAASDDTLASILFTMKTLQLQTKKMGEFQEETLRWNRTHHENLKRVLGSLNRLGQHLQSLRPSVDDRATPNSHFEPISAYEDPSLDFPRAGLLPQSAAASDSGVGSKDSFHDYIMSFENKQDKRELEKVLWKHGSNDVQLQLKEASAAIILRMIPIWLVVNPGEPLQESVEYALIYTELLHDYFPRLFQSRHNASVVHQIVDGMQTLIQYLPPEEDALRTFKNHEVDELRGKVVSVSVQKYN